MFPPAPQDAHAVLFVGLHLGTDAGKNRGVLASRPAAVFEVARHEERRPRTKRLQDARDDAGLVDDVRPAKRRVEPHKVPNKQGHPSRCTSALGKRSWSPNGSPAPRLGPRGSPWDSRLKHPGFLREDGVRARRQQPLLQGFPSRRVDGLDDELE